MFTASPLLGSTAESTACQTLLEFENQIQILIDVGWAEPYHPDQLHSLREQLPSISLILLTHATINHLGAYAYCCKHIPLFSQIPVYATAPVIALGRLQLQTLYKCDPAAASHLTPDPDVVQSPTQAQRNAINSILQDAPTAEEIAEYFAAVTPIKYSQPHQPNGSPSAAAPDGLTITAYNAGHSLGGTIWHLQCGLESVIHASDWNQGRENTLSSAAWLSSSAGTSASAEVIEQLHRPTALVCSTRCTSETTGPTSRAQRDRSLFAAVKPILAQGGTAVVPVDNGSRLFELAYILEQAWRKAHEEKGGSDILKTADLVMVSKQGNEILHQAPNMVEWMNDAFIRDFDAQGDNYDQADDKMRSSQGSGLLNFKNMKVVRASLEGYLSRSAAKINKGGRLILTDGLSLQASLDGEASLKFAQDSRNIIVLTSPSHSASGQPDSLSSFYSWYQTYKSKSPKAATDAPYQPDAKKGRQLKYAKHTAVPLTTAEESTISDYLSALAASSASLKQSGEASLLSTADKLEEDSSSDSSSDEDSESEAQGKLLSLATTLGRANRTKTVLTDEELGVNILLRKPDMHDWDLEGRKGKDRFFPIANKRKKWDEYGDYIKADDYLRADEKADLLTGSTIDNAPADNSPSKRKRADPVDPAQSPRSKRRANVRSANSRLKPPPNVLTRDARSPEQPEESFSSSEDEDTTDRTSKPRRKLITQTKTLIVKCRIAYVDFSALRDSQSYRILLPLIAPRKLILIGGSQAQTGALAEVSTSLMSGRDKDRKFEIFTPGDGETVDASVDTEAFDAVISSELYGALKWQRVKGGLKVVSLVARVEAGQKRAADADGERDAKRMKLEAGAGDESPTADPTDIPSPSLQKGTLPDRTSASQSQPRLVPLQPLPSDPQALQKIPASSASVALSAHQPLHLGDIRLPDLRRLLQSLSHAADFRGEGVMVVDGSVTLRKSAAEAGDGELRGYGGNVVEIESGAATGAGGGMTGRGGGEGTFERVREAVYGGLAVVSGA